MAVQKNQTFYRNQKMSGFKSSCCPGIANTCGTLSCGPCLRRRCSCPTGATGATGSTGATGLRGGAFNVAVLAIASPSGQLFPAGSVLARVEFPVEIADIGSNFSTSTFTAPSTGLYNFESVATLFGSLPTENNTPVTYQFVKTSGMIQSFYHPFSLTILSGDVLAKSLSTSGLIDLTVGDTVIVAISNSNRDVALISASLSVFRVF